MRTSKHKQRGWWQVAAAVAGGLLANKGAKDSNEAAQQNTAMSYDQTKALRRTAYQDTTHDLIEAGLNPMLAYGNGANSTSAMPVAQNRNEWEGAPAAVSSALQAGQLKAQNDLLEAQAEKVRAETAAIPSSVANVEQQTAQIKATIPKIEQEVKNLKLQARTEEERVILTRSQNLLAQIDAELRKGQIENTEAQTRTQNVLTQLKRLEIPGAKNLADFETMMSTGGGSAAGIGEKAGVILNSARKVLGK